MPGKRKNKRGNNKAKAAKAVSAKIEAAVAGLDDLKKGETLKSLGNDAFVAGSFRQAITFFTAAVEVKACEDIHASVYANRSACFGKVGEWHTAVDDANACIKLKPEWAKGYQRLGQALLHMGRQMDAQKAYTRGLDVDPDNQTLKDAIQEVRAIIRRKLNRAAERGEEEPESVKPKLGQNFKKSKDKDVVAAEASIGEYVIGIDLGTTFSCVAVWRNGKAEVLENADGKRTTPSWVAFTDEERLVGDQAKNQAAANPRRTLFNIKRIIGRQYAECREDIRVMPFDVKKGKGGKPVVEVDIDGKKNFRTFAPEQISAMVLERMKETAEAALGCKITKAVVTVPAYFNDSQRRLTKAAGAIAGLDVLRIINEPTAAALAYGLDKTAEKKTTDKAATNVLVFDLGGGTFDVSLLKIEDGVFRVLATAGDTHLGGEDFDSAMCQWVVNQLRHTNGGKDVVTGDQKLMRKVRNACERAKRQLSSTQAASIEFVLNGEDIELPITRSQFESLNEKIFQRCMNSVKQVMGDAKVSKDEVDDIVLVGGSTRVPRVREILSKYFNGKELSHSVHPDEAVAYGAAVQGAILSGVRDPITQALLLVDVTPLSLGVECQGKQFAKVLPRNSNVPCKRGSEFTTVQDYQTSIDIRIFEGERTHCDGNHLLGEFTINGVERAKKGEAKVQVTFEVNTNGLLSVSAYDKITGAEANVEIQHDRGRVSADDIERMVIEAAMLKDQDSLKIAEREASQAAASVVVDGAEDDDW